MMRKLLYLLALLIGVIYAYYKPMDKVANRLTVSQVHAQRMAEIEQEQVENIPTTETIIAEITRVFGPNKNDIRWAINCSFGESGWRYNAYNINKNGTTDHSIFQINSVHIKRFGTQFKYDWKENVRVAYELYKEQGSKIWYAGLCR